MLIVKAYSISNAVIESKFNRCSTANKLANKPETSEHSI